MSIGVNFFITGPKPTLKYSRRDRAWMAYNDEARIVADGPTKKEALAHFNDAWMEMFRERMAATWKAGPR